MLLHSLRLSFMQKIRKIYCAVFRENGVRERDRETERERQRDRDGPEYKGPPDAIAKPSDQKVWVTTIPEFAHSGPREGIFGKTLFAAANGN